jgi:hypothetical protein
VHILVQHNQCVVIRVSIGNLIELVTMVMPISGFSAVLLV